VPNTEGDAPGIVELDVRWFGIIDSMECKRESGHGVAFSFDEESSRII
jgi:hypothetical protein